MSDALRRLGERNKQTVGECRKVLSDTIRGRLSSEDFHKAMAAFDRAIETLRGSPGEREAMLTTLEAVGTQVEAGSGRFRRLNKPTIRVRR